MSETGDRANKSRSRRGKAEKSTKGTREQAKSFASARMATASTTAKPDERTEMAPKTASNAGVRPAIGAAEALSFLKETKGAVSWTAKDMAVALRISAKEAAQVLALLQIQGYVKSSGGSEWLTTPEGEAVSGAKTPRYSRASVQQALTTLKERIIEFNRDRAQDYKVAEAVAHGDFLNGQAQVQAADVGVRLARRRDERGKRSLGVGGPESAVEQVELNALLRKLRGRTALLHLRPYEPWMNHRAHLKLL